jgi:membrane protein
VVHWAFEKRGHAKAEIGGRRQNGAGLSFLGTRGFVEEPVSALKRVEGRIANVLARFHARLSDGRLTRLPWAVVRTFTDAEGSLLSGSMAYYTFLSLLPLLMITGFVLGTVLESSPGVQRALVMRIHQLLPGVKGRAVVDQLIEARAAFGIVGFLALSYAGIGFVGSLTACLNRMWGVQGRRSAVGQKTLNFVIVMLLGIVFLSSAAMTLWVTSLTRIVLGDSATLFVRLIDIVGGPVSLFIALLVLYRLLPARSLTWSSQVPGAILAVIGIEILKRGFALWADHSAGVAILPRSLLSVVLLLLWMGLFGQAILYGASLNVVLDRRRSGRSVFPAASRT